MKAPVETLDAIAVGILSERIRQMPVDSRALFLVAELSAIDGPAALAVLCDARNALTARIRAELDLRGLTDVPVVTQVEVDAEWAREIEMYRTSGSTPWAGVNSRADAAAFLSTASEEDIRATYNILLQGRPIPAEWSAAQAYIAFAVSSTEGIVRRVMAAVSAKPRQRFRWHPAGSERGDRS